MGSGMEICKTLGLPSYQHGIVFPQEECLYQKEATGMENPKMYCCIPWNNPTTCVGLQTTPLYGWQYRAGNGNKRNFGPTDPHRTAQKCIALVGAETLLTSAEPHTTPF